MFAVKFSKTFRTGTLAGLTVEAAMLVESRERADRIAAELDGLTLRECSGARNEFRVSNARVEVVN